MSTTRIRAIGRPADAPPHHVSEPVHILNGRFDPLTADQLVGEVMNTIRAGRRGVVCTVNVAILMMMRSDARLQHFIDASRWTVADGQPLVWASRLGPSPLPERVTGIDLIDLLCARAAREGVGVYFLGAGAETVRRVAETLRLRHPGVRIAGYANGYFRPEDHAARARDVAGSGAAIVFVGMGVPRQEVFIEEQWDRLGANVVVGVGGSFDVIAGLRKRAPPFLQRAGLEWAYRLAQEPRRLFRRYLLTNCQFLVLMIGQQLARGVSSWRPLPKADET